MACSTCSWRTWDGCGVASAEDSNTAEEKARFIAEMWALLRSSLGTDMRETSYIVIRETKRDAYGAAGLTRAERDRRGPVA